MNIQHLLPGFYCIPCGQVNTFLLEDSSGFVLIDTGYPGSETYILKALAEIQRKPSDIHDIILTHFHPDHAGGLGMLKQTCAAVAWMHPLDAAQVRSGNYHRPSRPGPGLVPQVIYRLFIANARADIPPVEIENDLQDGMVLPIAGGLQAIHTPGHTAGHTALYWKQNGGVLIAGDLVTHIMGLGWAPIYEDFSRNFQSLEAVAGLDYQMVVFSHGTPILKDGSTAVHSFILKQRQRIRK